MKKIILIGFLLSILLGCFFNKSGDSIVSKLIVILEMKVFVIVNNS